MAFYYNAQHQQHHAAPAGSHAGHSHHGARSRRAPRVSSQNSHRQFRGVRNVKELSDAPTFSVFRQRFEACKGFELDDDLEFCPGLLTEDDLHSIHSSASDRSSLSSGSPSASPVQQQVHPAPHVSPPFAMAQASYGYQPSQLPRVQQPAAIKIHQPSALRTRSAIPIVDPSTMQRVASPPPSVSPARMQQQTYLRRQW